MNVDSKKINIVGISNRYKIKQLTNDKLEKETKKRIQSEKWSFSEEEFEYSKQIKMINEILNNNFNYFDDVSKIAIQEINRKIYGYKQKIKIK